MTLQRHLLKDKKKNQQKSLQTMTDQRNKENKGCALQTPTIKTSTQKFNQKQLCFLNVF